MRHPRRAPLLNGFTLIELLVAASITLLLGVLLLSVTQRIAATQTQVQGGINRQADISFVVDQLTQDLESLVVPNAGGAEGLRLTRETVGANTNAPWLAFLATALDPDESRPVPVGGATRAISYRMALQRTLPGAPASHPESYGIYRSIASSAQTFQNAMSRTNLQTYWQSLPPSPTPTPQPPTAPGSLLAENIVAVDVQFQYRNSSGNLVWTQPEDTVSIREDGAFLNGQPVPGGFLRAQVAVAGVTPEGARRLREGSVTLEEAIERYGTTAARQTAFFY